MTFDELKGFCSCEPGRQFLHSPFISGEHTYATDGRILIRIARVPAETPGLALSGPDVSEVWADEFCPEPVALPAEIPPVAGYVDEDAIGVPVGCQRLSHLYLNKIKNLPGLKIYNARRELGPVHFTFDGGEGKLMPVVADDAHR